MTNWTDKTKNAATFINKAIRGKWKWSDPNALWSDPRFTWGGVGTVNWANQGKSHTTTMTTNNPFFGWLFWFTQANTTTSTAVWSNKTKH